jgi:hypothetical protein
VAAAADIPELASLAGRNLVGSRIDVQGAPLRYRLSGSLSDSGATGA